MGRPLFPTRSSALNARPTPAPFNTTHIYPAPHDTMHTRTKLTFTALTATVLMGLAVHSATAGRLSTSNTRFRATWTALKFDGLEIESPVICPLTLEGSFHSATIRKTRGALIGAITRAIVGGAEPPCTGGRATILQESLPWHVTYQSFSGTLPRIEEITFLASRYAYRVEVNIGIGNIACLYKDQGRPEENLAGSVAVNRETGQVTTETPLEGRYASWIAGSSFCPRRASHEGVGQVFLLGSNTTRITITLI
jgi:hypothetical protein